MVKQVNINQKTALKLSATADYLEKEFSPQAADKFIKSVYDIIDKIKAHPTRGRKVPTMKTVQFINIDKHRQIYYRVQGTILYIVDFFDTRQDPDKRPF